MNVSQLGKGLIACMALLACAPGVIARQGPIVVWDTTDPAVLNVPAGNFIAVDGGANFGIGIRDDRTLVGWGDNLVGQTNVPSGTFLQVSGGELHTLGIRTDGTLAAWGLDSSGNLNVPSGTFSKVFASAHKNIALRTDGTIAVWGAIASLPAPPSGLFLDVAASAGDEDFFVALRADGTLVAWGSDTNGFGTLNPPSGQFVSVAAGLTFGVALRADGTVAKWGQGGGNPAVLGLVRQLSPDLFSIRAIRHDGTLVQTSGGPPPPSGTFSSLGSGGTFGLAVVPAPPVLAVVALAMPTLIGRRRKNSSR